MKNDVSKAVLEEFFVFNPENGQFRWLNSSGRMASGQRAGSLRKDGYRVLRFPHEGRRFYLMEHRAAWIMAHGSIPPDQEIDHINRERSDNRLANLRLAARCDNTRNRRPIRGAQFKGVHFEKGATGRKKWRAYISVLGKRTHIGRFETQDEALEAYKRKALELHGDFAAWS